MKKEKWKRLNEHKEYLISTWGRIYSLKNKKFVRPYIHKSRANNYLRVSLKDRKKYMVHILVAENFRQKQKLEVLKNHPYAKLQVNHKDRNTLNPNFNNIEWCTEKENKAHLSRTNSVLWGIRCK